MEVWFGIFVGGQNRRMGGQPKGWLESPEAGPLWARLVRECEKSCDDARVVLVGHHPAYRGVGLPAVQDHPDCPGPLGGLWGLLEAAQRAGAPYAVALACDLPRVSASLLGRLLRHCPEAAVVAPRRERWEPLCARYAPERVLPVVGEVGRSARRSLMAVLDVLGGACVPLPAEDGDAAELEDWDRPEDLPSTPPFPPGR